MNDKIYTNIVEKREKKHGIDLNKKLQESDFTDYTMYGGSHY